jgi:DNA (cytosine-5)-methyltransferase 1
VRPRLLDLFCGAGGAAMGYNRAGFEVVGVDIEPQPDYPFRFYRWDALDVLERLGAADTLLPGWTFDAIHASPPCPVHSSLNGWSGDSTSPDLVPQTREALQATGLPYVIENVPGAPLVAPVQLCGQALGLKVRRHRLFECSFSVMVPQCQHPEPPVIVVGGSIGRKVFDPRRKAIAPSFEEAKEVMGMPWVATRQGVVNAIPPAYTEHIGGYLLAHLAAERAAA